MELKRRFVCAVPVRQGGIGAKHFGSRRFPRAAKTYEGRVGWSLRVALEPEAAHIALYPTLAAFCAMSDASAWSRAVNMSSRVRYGRGT